MKFEDILNTITLEIDSSEISKCCRKKLKKAGDYIWQFAE